MSPLCSLSPAGPQGCQQGAGHRRCMGAGAGSQDPDRHLSLSSLPGLSQASRRRRQIPTCRSGCLALRSFRTCTAGLVPGPLACTLPCSLPQGAENEIHRTQLLGSTGAVCGEPPMPPAVADRIFPSSSSRQSLQPRERRPSEVGDLLGVTQLGGDRARLHTQVLVAPKLSTLHITVPGTSGREEGGETSP